MTHQTDYGPQDQILAQVPDTQARVFIQWKGTEVCMDLHCGDCNYHNHYDGMFGHFTVCANCGTAYQMGTAVKAIKVEDGREPYIPPLVDES